MARLHRRHSLDGLSGNVGKHLHLHEKGDGRLEVRILDASSSALADMHWQQFKEAVAYARRAQHASEYQEAAEREHSTPFKVATADFLHPPEIVRVDVDDYHGQVGDCILIHADDDVGVTQVGVIITDGDNHLIEMGMALASGTSWRYLVTKPAHTHHVRVIVDAADLPGHITESRLEKDI